ncbi:hypothetical protein HF882_06580 [Victivallis vadensis]|uniref:Uncharacterized protein n=2 Tax=Victivallis vadensis TaxID=172901 RepID=A0A848ASY4_9BACT|nr:hypothetical protein [Victivallis vadensis]NMD86248.1 hypothetical protein [Victivallis vadensis]HJH05745.1 hypothetical protein [Victivallis vadensis]
MSFPEAELARGVELDGAGFLPRRGESAEQFFRRVETILGIHREFEAELAAAGEVGVYGLQLRSQDRIPDEIIGEAEEVTDRLYSFRTRHVPGFFLSRDVGLLWGGCMICDPDHPLSVFLIRGAFRKRQRWLFYNRRELLAHELCHSMRQSLEEITLEEYFAYQTSPSRLRRYLGNCFIREYDAIWFVIPALLLLLAQVAQSFWLPGLPVWPFWPVALAYPAFLLIRNGISRRLVKRAAKKLAAFGVEKPSAVLFRLDRGEIRRIGAMERPGEFEQYAAERKESDFRWAILYARFLTGNPPPEPEESH